MALLRGGADEVPRGSAPAGGATDARWVSALCIAGQASGWRRPAIGFVVAAVALPIVYAGASWPVYVALYSDLPAVLDWILSAVMLGLCVVFAVVSTFLAEKWRAGLRNRQNNPRADPALV